MATVLLRQSRKARSVSAGRGHLSHVERRQTAQAPAEQARRRYNCRRHFHRAQSAQL